MKDELASVQDLMKTIEKDRVQKFSTLAEQIQQTNKVTKELSDSASQLKNALASSKTRGQWGERMAEDILRLSGLKEGINYLKQKALQSTSTRPDYTFLLPNDLSVNMDVKFPLDNYSAYLNSENDDAKKKYKDIFLRDIRSRIKEVTSRDYINPDENTVDYVLVFIPNEQIYSFVMEHDSNLIDESLKQKVILCSPITLYAILAIIRQAVDNFSLEKKASLIIALMNTFHKQWEKFIESLEKMGRRIDDAKKEYDSLISTRRSQLEKPLLQIDELRKESGIKIEPMILELPSHPKDNDEKEDRS
jgi:DNA recombination protein RmuC